jgi:VWFA-related protein
MNPTWKSARIVWLFKEPRNIGKADRTVLRLLACAVLVGSLFPALATWGQTTKQPTATAPPAGQQEKPDSPQPQRNAAQPTDQEEGPPIKVRVNVVEVRVVVRDERGKVVENLKQDDFKLLDNGKPQAISGFAMEFPPSPNPPAPIAVAPGEKAPVLKPIFPDRFVALLFDDVHMSMADTQASAKGTLAFLDGIRPNDRMAFYSTSGMFTQEFTANKQDLKNALKQLIPRPRTGNHMHDCPDVSYYMAKQVDLYHDDGAFNLIVKDALHCAYQDDPHMISMATSMAHSAVSQQVELGRADNNFMYDQVQGVVEKLSSMPGRKTMVFVSPGFSLDENKDRLWLIMDEANRLKIVINTLDARGLFTPAIYDASRSGTQSPETGQYKLQEEQDQGFLLSNLADGTGGTHFHNSNDLEGAMKQLGGAPAVTYVLLFTPPEEKKDGSFHKLKVELVQKGQHYQVQARNGYYAEKKDTDPKEILADEMQTALVSPKDIQEMPLELLAKFTKTGADPAEITVVTRLNIKDVEFRKADDRHINQITVVTAIFDENGNAIQHQEKTVELKLTDATYQKLLETGIVMKGAFAVKPGNYVVRQLIREADNGKMAMQTGVVELPPQ